MKQGKTFALLALIGSLLVAGAFFYFLPPHHTKAQFTPAEMEWLQQHSHSIRIAPLPDSPPIDFIDDRNNPKGLTTDYVRLIEQQLGVRFVVVKCDSWKTVLDKLKNQEIDLVGSVQNTTDRRAFLHFTKPYLEIPNVILTQRDETTSYSIDQMGGLRIAIVESSATYDYLSMLYPDYLFVPVKDASTGFEKLSFKEVDAMVADLGVASYYIERMGITNLRVAGDIDYAWKLCFASRKDWPVLSAILEKALDNVTVKQRREIQRKWITLSNALIIPRDRYIKIIGIILLFTLLATGSVICWNQALQRQVTRRTQELGNARESQALAAHERDISDERFRILIETSADIIWEMDNAGNYTYVSPRVSEILGYEPRHLIGRSALSLMIPPDAAVNIQRLRDATAQTVIDCEINTHIHQNGSKVILETRGMAFTDNIGRLAGFRGVSRNITERIQTEAEKKASQERFRNLVETTSDWIWELDAEGYYTYASPQVTNLLGYTPEELVGKRVTYLLPPEHKEDTGTHLAAMMEQGAQIHAMVKINRHKDGRTVMLETSGVPYYDEKWNIMGYRGIDRDITSRIAAEKQLVFERNLFHTFMEYVPHLVYFKDSQGHFIEVNTAKAKEVRLAPDEVIGKTDADFLPTEQAEQRMADELEVMHTQKPIQKEEHVDTPDGERWYLTTLMPRYDEDGKLAGTFGTSWDITSRKQAADELRKLRSLLSNTIDSMPSILVGVDLEGRVIQWNHEAEQLTNISKKDATGKLLDEVYPELTREKDKIERAIRERITLKNSRVPHVESNQTRYYDITIFPLLDENVAGGAVIRIDNITERVRMEEMMVQSEKMMSVGGLAAGMAHEINNPLAGIMQNLQVMHNRISQDSERNTAVAKEAGTSLATVQAYMEKRGLTNIMDSVLEAGRRAIKIVDNMLSFSRKVETVYAPNDLASIMDQSIELAANEYNLKKRFDFRHVKITREYDSALEHVPCEKNQIQQVILNLLSNSAHAMAEQEDGSEEPQIIMRLRKEGCMALIEVEDNGPGMDEETRKRAFEPFFTTKEVGQGTGLGLSVSYFIITENHGGTMGVVSEPNQGACFSLRIPLKRET